MWAPECYSDVVTIIEDKQTIKRRYKYDPQLETTWERFLENRMTFKVKVYLWKRSERRASNMIFRAVNGL